MPKSISANVSASLAVCGPSCKCFVSIFRSQMPVFIKAYPATGLSLPTIKRAESERDVSVSDEAIAAIRSALEKAAVEFIAENGGGPGVRLRKVKRKGK